MELAFNSRHPYVHKYNRWIASLSDGATVFEDKAPNVPSAWRRLSKYIKLHSLEITNLRLEAYGRRVTLLPYRGAKGDPQIDGYWQSSRIGSYFGGGLRGEFNWRGIGYVVNDTIHIVWIDHEGNITHEARPLDPSDQAVILNHAI